MEELNKTQVILLTLLISFVTSIATGIVTVTLLDQAPPAVTQTINRVVEKTIERVVPGETKIVERIKEVETVKTDDDLVIKAVNDNVSALVRITIEQSTIEGEKILHTQTGFLINTDGVIVTVDEGIVDNKTYEITWNKDKRNAEVIGIDRVYNIALLKLLPDKDTLKKDVISPIKLSEQAPVLGQSAIGLGAHESDNAVVSLGIISGIRSETSSTTARINTTVDVTRGNKGGPLLNLRGLGVGVLVDSGKDVGEGIVIPASIIKKLLDKVSSVKDQASKSVI